MIKQPIFSQNLSFDYQFKRFGVLVSEVRVSTCMLPNGKKFVLLSDTGRNTVAKNTEQIATRLKERLGLDPENTIWGERYQDSKNRIDIVDYIWDSVQYKYLNPKWNKAPDWMTEYILTYTNDSNIFSINLN